MYLGSPKTATASCSADVKSKIAIAKRRMMGSRRFGVTKTYLKNLNARPVKALVWSTLIYGADAWTLFKSDEKSGSGEEF